jgi:Icc protein
MSNVQFNWLQNELVTDKHIMLFIHHPVFGIDTPIDKKYPLAGRERIAEALQQSGKSVTIFCGHYHMGDVLQVRNITQHITPASSYQITKHADEIEGNSSTFGYRLINVDDNVMVTNLLMYRLGRFVSECEED